MLGRFSHPDVGDSCPQIPNPQFTLSRRLQGSPPQNPARGAIGTVVGPPPPKRLFFLNLDAPLKGLRPDMEGYYWVSLICVPCFLLCPPLGGAGTWGRFVLCSPHSSRSTFLFPRRANVRLHPPATIPVGPPKKYFPLFFPRDPPPPPVSPFDRGNF